MNYEVTSYEDLLKHPAPHIRASDLIKMQLPPVKWAVEDLISQGVTIFAGPPKCGKSTLITDIGLSVASGTEALGKLGVQQGTVLYFALEPNLQDLQAELEIMQQGEEMPRDFIIIPKSPSVHEGGNKVIENDLKHYSDVVLVIIDTMGRMRGPVLPTRENSYNVNLTDMDLWAGLSKRYNVNIVLIHHTRKGEKGNEITNPLEEVMGSYAIVGSADTILVMGKSNAPQSKIVAGCSNRRTIFRTGRSPLIQEKQIEVGFNFSTHRSQIESGIIDDTEERAQIKQAMLKIQAGGRHSVQPKEVAEYLGKDNRGAVRKLMLTMFQQNQIQKVGYGHYRLD